MMNINYVFEINDEIKAGISEDNKVAIVLNDQDVVILDGDITSILLRVREVSELLLAASVNESIQTH